MLRCPHIFGSRPTLLGAVIVAIVVPGSAPATAGPTPPVRSVEPGRTLSSWRTESSPMPLAVIAAAAVEIEGRLHLLGGVDRRFEATAVIQSHAPREGWRPIGDRLAKPRAEASAVRLSDGRVLLLGGFAGTASTPVWHEDGEVLDPEIAGSAIELPSFGESLEGHSATPLADGTVLVVAGGTARRLHPEADLEADPAAAWGPAASLPESRRGHAAVRLDERRVLVVCGADPAAPEASPLLVIEVSDDPTSPPTVVAGPSATDADLPPGLRESAAARDPTTSEILVAGGFEPAAKRTVGETWWIDIERGVVRPGLPLPGDRGAARVHLAETERGVAILGGEWRTPTGRGGVDLGLIAVGGAGLDRRLGLASLPVSATRRMRVLGDGIELIGGYRYRSPEEAAATGLPPGVHFDTRRYRLNLAVFDRGD